MTRTWKFENIRWACTMALSLAGCAWQKPFSARTTAESVSIDDESRGQVPDVVIPDAEPEPPPVATLAAIESFLRRTEDFADANPAPSHSSAKSGAVPGPNLAPSAVDPIPAPERPFGSTAKPPEKIAANSQMVLPDSPRHRPELSPPVVLGVNFIAKPASSLKPQSQPATTTNVQLNLVNEAPRVSWQQTFDQLDAEARTSKDFDLKWAAGLARHALYRDHSRAEWPAGSAKLMPLVFDALEGLKTSVQLPDQPTNNSLRALEQLRAELSNRADLEVPVVEICKRVLTFGVYDEIPASDLVSGRTIPAIVYVEARNLVVQQNADGKSETRLSIWTEILSVDGRSVWEESDQEVVDTCRRPRHDFFLAQRLVIPATLPGGPYVLKVTVEDKVGGKIGEGSRPFELVTPLPIAKGD